MTWRAGILLVLCATAAAAEEDELTPLQRDALRAVVERLRKYGGHLTAKRAAAFELAEFDADELARLPARAPEEVREPLARICGTVALWRGPLGELKKSADICWLLASADAAAWANAGRLLRRERTGARLERAVLALRADERPEVRLLAVRMATTLVVFGSRNENLRDTVLAGIDDPHPHVAGHAAYHALDIRDKRVVDRMLAHVEDERMLPEYGTTVGAVTAQRLSWTIFTEERARMGWGTPAVPPLDEPRTRTPDELRKWWRRSHENFGFGTPAPWKCVHDDVLVLTRGTPVVVELADGTPLRLVLLEHREAWLDGRPVTTIRVKMTDVRYPRDPRELSDLGNPEHSDWWLPGGGADWPVEAPDGSPANGSAWWRAVFLPTHRLGRVRMRLFFYVRPG